MNVSPSGPDVLVLQEGHSITLPLFGQLSSKYIDLHVTQTRTTSGHLHWIDQCFQRIEYFEKLQIECKIKNPCRLTAHSNIQWGSAEKMLRIAYENCAICVPSPFKILEQLISFVANPLVSQFGWWTFWTNNNNLSKRAHSQKDTLECIQAIQQRLESY